VDQWQMHVYGGSKSEAQSTCNHIAHLELVDKALEEKRHIKLTRNNKMFSKKQHNIWKGFLFSRFHLML
jgi:hypothetical protein